MRVMFVGYFVLSVGWLMRVWRQNTRRGSISNITRAWTLAVRKAALQKEVLTQFFLCDWVFLYNKLYYPAIRPQLRIALVGKFYIFCSLGIEVASNFMCGHLVSLTGQVLLQLSPCLHSKYLLVVETHWTPKFQKFQFWWVISRRNQSEYRCFRLKSGFQLGTSMIWSNLTDSLDFNRLIASSWSRWLCCVVAVRANVCCDDVIADGIRLS